jgi:glycosyltransferase involved in cell wall biosynthesis
MTTPRRIVVVPYYYPPFWGSGNRWPTLVKYLRELGHTVTVLATDAYGRLEDDDASGVQRVHDLRASAFVRRLLRRDAIPTAGSSASDQPAGPLLTKLMVPDAYAVSWLPAAAVATRRLLARSSIDVVITSSPPESVHLLGLLLGQRRPAWVADFRDGWTFEPLRPAFPTGLQRRVDNRLERAVAQQADAVVAATGPIADDLVQRLGAHATCISNAWDPALTATAAAAPRLGEPPERRIVLTGKFSGVRGSNPEALLWALALIRKEPNVPPLCLVLAGPLLEEDRALIAATGNEAFVSHVGIIDRSAAIALQRSADALLLITSRNSSEATGKLFEYIGANRPVLALAEGNEAARIVEETGIGVAVAPDDISAIADALRAVARGELPFAPRNLERFTYPGPAEAFMTVVEEAIARRRTSRT